MLTSTFRNQFFFLNRLVYFLLVSIIFNSINKITESRQCLIQNLKIVGQKKKPHCTWFNINSCCSTQEYHIWLSFLCHCVALLHLTVITIQTHVALLIFSFTSSHRKSPFSILYCPCFFPNQLIHLSYSFAIVYKEGKCLLRFTNFFFY